MKITPYIDYFNAHTDSLGYINRIKWVESADGHHKPFVSVTYCQLEGDPSNPDKLYINLTISNPKVCEALQPHFDAINDKDTQVFARVRLAMIRAKPFVYPSHSPKSGQLGVNYSARMISLKSLKIGLIEIDLPDSEDRTQAPAVEATRQPAAQHSHCPTPQPKPVKGRPAFAVELLKSDPDFHKTKESLKQGGYWYHSGLNLWCLPEVTLEGDDSKLSKQHAELAELGYQPNDHSEMTWTLQFPKSMNRSKGNRYQGQAKRQRRYG